jgi:cell division protein FtsB
VRGARTETRAKGSGGGRRRAAGATSRKRGSRAGDATARSAATTARAKSSARPRRAPLRRQRIPRWLLPLVVLGAVGFLYYQPITTYLETREQLAERRSEVATLRTERARVTARLERATSLEELARAARRIGYVRPDEHLFIVKGTAAWSREHSG